MKKVSIIVPIYNAEKYLRKCVDSLVNQTLDEIEIILVSDASPDGSNDIMEEYRKNYPEKIRCIYLEENVKQGGARNRGIDIASGEYITFVDSDDYIDSTMCEKMYAEAKKHDYDIVFCDYWRDYIDENKKTYGEFIGDELTGSIDRAKRMAYFFCLGMPWAKLTKRELIEKNHIRFPEGILYEDGPMTMLTYLYANKIGKINEPLYFWYVRKDSTIHNRNSAHHFDPTKVGLEVYDRLKNRGFYDEYKDEVDALFIRYFYIITLENMVEKFDALPLEMLYYLRNTMKEMIPNYKDNPYHLLYKKIQIFRYAELNDESPERFKEFVESGAFKQKEYTYEDVYLKRLKYNISLLEECKSRGLKVALWGAGRKGKDFLRITDPSNIYIKYVFDRNSKLYNSVMNTGHIIQNFDEKKNEVDVIMCTNSNVASSVKYMLWEKGICIRVIDLEVYMRTKLYFNNMGE